MKVDRLRLFLRILVAASLPIPKCGSETEIQRRDAYAALRVLNG